MKGCNGGLPEDAYEYIKEQGGIDTEESYPYEAKDGKCRYNPDHKGARVSGFTKVPSGDENTLKQAIATQVKYFQFLKYFSRNILILQGPCSVGIDAHNPSIQFYSGGIYSEPACSSSEMFQLNNLRKITFIPFFKLK